MSTISPLKNIHLNGQFGDYEGKDEKDLLKITEKKDLLIVQIVQYKNSTLPIDSLTIDGLKLVVWNEGILAQEVKSWATSGTANGVVQALITDA